MPEAKFASILSNPASRYPRITLAPVQKPKLLDQNGLKKTTMTYTPVLNRGPAGVRSPVDGLLNGTRWFYADPHKMPR